MTTPRTTPCPYEQWDGAYVLGSLSPAERREFEAHLDGCDVCSRSVRDLAGLPGLLGRVDPEVFASDEPEPVPDTLLPRLVRATRRQQRRRTWLTAGVAAAAAAVITVGGAVAVEHATSPSPAVHVAIAPSHPMTRVGTDPMTARVALTRVSWGTRLDLSCSYPGGGLGYQNGGYALVVHTAGGHAERVATWNGVPGHTMRLTAATASPVDQITSVDITHLDGTRVLTLRL